MAKTNRNVRSIEDRVAHAANAGKTHEWPDEIPTPSKNAASIYRKIQAQRAHDDWPPLELFEIARLANMLDQYLIESQVLDQEGSIRATVKGDALNPRVKAVSALNASINLNARRLGLTAMSVPTKLTRATSGKARRDQEALRGKTIGTKYSDDGLLN